MFDTGFPKDWSTLKKLVFLRGSGLGGGGSYITLVGDIVRFMASSSAPFRKLQIALEPIQAGSGDPSPDNVRPISGRTSATVTRTGKNLYALEDKTRSVRGTKLTIANQAITIKNTPTGGSASFSIPNFDGLTDSCALSITSALPNGVRIYCKRTNKSTGVVDYPTQFSGTGGTTKYVLNPSANTYENCYIEVSTSYDGTEFSFGIQLELGSTASAYEPYQGNTYTIQLGDTVYGGTLDVTAGTLTVTHILFNRNSSTMNNSSAYPGWKDAGLNALGYTGAGSVVNALLNIGSEFSYNCANNNDILFLGTGAYHKTQEEWKALAIDIQIVIPLVTPIEITLTPQTINSLAGENNVWDDGTVTVEVKGEAIT